MSEPGRHLVAWVAIALWLAYAWASYRELGERPGSHGLKALSTVASVAMLAALVWSGWPS